MNCYNTQCDKKYPQNKGIWYHNLSLKGPKGETVMPEGGDYPEMDYVKMCEDCYLISKNKKGWTKID